MHTVTTRRFGGLETWVYASKSTNFGRQLHPMFMAMGITMSSVVAVCVFQVIQALTE
jgi:hypothetical protein